MKITFSTSVINTIDAGMSNILSEVTGEASTEPSLVSQFEAIASEDNVFANRSITKVGDEYVLEINDELFTRYMSMYIRIAKAIGPFIKPVMNLVGLLKDDIAGIEAFINAKK